ncbi:MAG: DUF1800 domain-containing protein [Betaproteobacteria bacterium]|nr:DUF1800 domain-containing protein [Betaproteobacteria bacterium]
MHHLIARLARIVFFAGASLAGSCLSAWAEPLGEADARHLLARTGFGATPAEVADFARLDRRVAVERILAGARTQATLAPPSFVEEPFFPYYKVRALSAQERMAYQRRNVEEGLQLREWWFREMLTTASPLTERMTLFWHGHFATSQQKVRSSLLVYRQNALLRSHALGNFGSLLRAVSKDPAMLVYLDSAGSRREAPNENFAREVMELFTLGEGHYAEKDIKEAARAFTGWSLDRDTGEFRYRPFFHDGGMKTIFGRSGRFDGDDVLALLLERPEAATFITRKLWKEFVSPNPDEREVQRLAAVFREARLEVTPLIRAILLADAFWSPSNRGTIVKSPVELVVGTLRTFEISPTTLRPAVAGAALLGQNVMSPPNVKGWPGGDAWINSATLLGRKQFLDRLFRGSDAMAAIPMQAMTAQGGATAEATPEARFRHMMERGMATYSFDWDRWARAFPGEAGRAARVQGVVLAIAPVDPSAALLDGPALVRALTADPAYQLK